MQLAIKINSLASNFHCCLCGQQEHANVGPQLFVADSWAPVCGDCGDLHSPLLSHLVDLALSARAFASC